MKTPTIDDARALGAFYGLEGVVIIFHNGEEVGYTSWGHTRSECSWMRRFADKAFAVLNAMWQESR